jgi:hypothetical protein
MTFVPEVTSKTDINNSSNTNISNTFTGISTITNGYNTIIITLYSNVSSTSGGLAIQFSDDNINWTTNYTDTYIETSNFIKSYKILKKYYKILYTSSLPTTTFTITSRLVTDLDSSSINNNSIAIFDNSIENTIDAFGKLRVSNPNTLLDIRFPGQTNGSLTFRSNDLQVATKSSGTFTGTFSNSKLIINGIGTGYYISQSRNYCVYQPGKSLLILMSGIINPGNNTFKSRFGYFENIPPVSPSTEPTVSNGLYYECSGNIMSVNLKNDITTKIIQSNWNIDKMDGTGISGVSLDFTKTQLFLIDMEWLGVGRIRFGFYIYGRIQYCHQITNLNILTSSTAPYTNSINLPISHTLIGTGSNSNTGNITQICSTVISEGGYNPVGRPFSVSSNTTTVLVSNVLGELPILAIRGGANGYHHHNIVPMNSLLIDTGNNNTLLYNLRLYKAGDTPCTGSITWTNVNSNYSVCQYARYSDMIYSGSTFRASNSIIVDSSYFAGKFSNLYSNLSSIFSNLILQITSDIDNVSDILVITCHFIGAGSTSILGSISWTELY